MRNKVAIYTCITSGYDDPWNPKNLPEDFGWFCLTPDDEKVKRLGDYSPAMINRYCKMHPEEVLPKEYEYSVYLDGNISVADPKFFDIIRSLIDKDVIYAGIKHPQRDDVFEESYRIIRNGRDSISNMIRVTRFLKKEGFPEHYGMMENNVIFRKHSDDRVEKFDSEWWKMFSSFPNRDQMTHSYCLWKTGIPFEYLPLDGEDARTSKLFKYSLHGSDKNYKDISFSGRIKDAKRMFQKFIYRIYLKNIGIKVTDL